MASVALLATPGLASLLVTGLAWLVAPGRHTRWRRTPAALVALMSGAFGALVYFGHAADVSESRALAGTAIAVAVTAVPLSVYYAMGRFVRSAAVLVISWIASQMLLYPYAFLALLYVIQQTQCGPAATDCPID